MTSAESSRETISWHWSFFLLGAIYAVPAMVVTPFSPSAGLALAVGVMPVAAFNLPGIRRGRRVIPLIGALCAIAFLIGSILTQVPWIAVLGILALAVGASLWARHGRIGALALALCVPLVGIGLSFSSVALAAVLGLCILAGSVYAYGVAMLWPEHQVPPQPRPPRPSRADTVLYGVLLGLAGATAAAVSYALHLEHVGWATGSALLVMRPVRDQLVLRSIGRAASVLVGAFAAAAFALLQPGDVMRALAVGLTLAALAATQSSRWYVAPGFTSFIALTLLLVTTDVPPGARFAERVLETLLGVGVALFFGAVIPAVIRAWRRRRAAAPIHTDTDASPSDERTTP